MEGERICLKEARIMDTKKGDECLESLLWKMGGQVQGSMNSLWPQAAWLCTFLEKHWTSWCKSEDGKCLQLPRVHCDL